MDALPPGIDLCLFPAQMPPAGQKWNFVNPTTLQPAAIAVGVVVTALSVLFTSLRVWVNRRKLHIADYSAIVATVMSVVYTAVSLSFSKYDRHQWDVPACWFNEEYLKILFVQLLIFGPTVFFSKAAIFLMYLQFFGIKKTMRIAVYLGLAVSFIAYWTSVPVAAYYGAPHVGEEWDDLLVNLRPANEAYWGVAQGVSAVVLDVYIFILPLPVLWHLHMDRSKRMQLLGLFGTALIAVAASCVALNYRFKLLGDGKLAPAQDTTWNQGAACIAVLIEGNIAIIVGDMPAFAAFVRATTVDSNFFRSLQSKLLRGAGSGKPSGSWTKESLPKYNNEARHSKSLQQENPYLIHQQQEHTRIGSFDSLEQVEPYYQEEHQHRNAGGLSQAQGDPYYELRDASGFVSEAAVNSNDKDPEQGHRGGIMRSTTVVQEVQPKYPDTAARR